MSTPIRFGKYVPSDDPMTGPQNLTDIEQEAATIQADFADIADEYIDENYSRAAHAYAQPQPDTEEAEEQQQLCPWQLSLLWLPVLRHSRLELRYKLQAP